MSAPRPSASAGAGSAGAGQDDGLDAVVDSVERAAESPAAQALARAGLASRGVIYLLIGLLAALLAGGSTRAHVDQKGAMAQVLAQPYGSALVVALAVGFAGYALWRLSEAAFGVTGEGNGAGPRLKSLARGVAYVVLSISAVSLLRGATGSQAQQQSSLVATVLGWPAGRWIVTVVGLGVIVAGLAMVAEGVKHVFMRYFSGLPPRLRVTVRRLGTVGTIGRGLVFALIGVLVMSAGWNVDPHDAGGMDTAFRTLLSQPYGQVLGYAAALALMAFGIYGLAEARWRRV